MHYCHHCLATNINHIATHACIHKCGVFKHIPKYTRNVFAMASDHCNQLEDCYGTYAPQRSYNSRCIRILEEGTLLQTYYNKSNNHTSKSNTHVTVGSIIKYVNRLSVHYPLPNKIATASAKSCSKL